jgi:hypothetical protein
MRLKMSTLEPSPETPNVRVAPGVIVDPDWLSAASPDIQAVYAYWKAKGGNRRMPARADIDPADIVPYLPSIMLVDVGMPTPDSVAAEPARGHYVYRLVGTREVEMRGSDPTGKPVATHGLGGMTDLALQNYDTVVRTRAPLLDGNEEDIQLNDRYLDLECVFLPLSSDGDRVDMVLVYTVQRPVS